MVQIELGGAYIRGEARRRDPEIKKPTEKEAQFQLECIQKYLQSVGQIQAECLKKINKLKKQDVSGFSMAESNALYYKQIGGKFIANPDFAVNISPSPEKSPGLVVFQIGGKFILKINWNVKKIGKWLYSMSWLFERLQHLICPSTAIPSPPLFKQPKKVVLRTGYELINRENMNIANTSGGFTGSGRDGNIYSFVAIDDFYSENYPRTQDSLEEYRRGRRRLSDIPALEPVQVGKAIMHELAIHAWRLVYFSDVQGCNPDMNAVEAFLFNKHRANCHAGWQNSDEHNWADVEADMIELYHPAKAVYIGLTDIVQRCPRRKKSRLIAGFEGGYKLYWHDWEKKYKELLKKKNK